MTLNVTVLVLAGARLPVNVHLIAPVVPMPGEFMAIAVTLLGIAPCPALLKVVNAGVLSKMTMLVKAALLLFA